MNRSRSGSDPIRSDPIGSNPIQSIDRLHGAEMVAARTRATLRHRLLPHASVSSSNPPLRRSRRIIIPRGQPAPRPGRRAPYPAAPRGREQRGRGKRRRRGRAGGRHDRPLARASRKLRSRMLHHALDCGCNPSRRRTGARRVRLVAERKGGGDGGWGWAPQKRATRTSSHQSRLPPTQCREDCARYAFLLRRTSCSSPTPRARVGSCT